MDEITVVMGTRPEIVKMAPVIRALRGNGMPMTLAYCGQHYDYNMSQQFIEELGLPAPDYSYKVKAQSQNIQTARIMTHMDNLLSTIRPSLVLVEGDTNSVLATALAAGKLRTRVGHVEAGLRSFDLRMPEEHNRRLTDHISSYLFAPTQVAKRNLKKESVWGRIYVTGNTVIDAVIQHLPIAEKNSRILDRIHFDEYALATVHRAENVDDPDTLMNIIAALEKAPLPVVCPMHPRTRRRLSQIKTYRRIVNSKNIQLLPPVGYLDFLVLMKNCRVIVTDSGGIQEEATAPPIRKPVIVVRLSTERPEAVKRGFARVSGTDETRILDTMRDTLSNPTKLPSESPFGNGDAAKKIVRIIKRDVKS